LKAWKIKGDDNPPPSKVALNGLSSTTKFAYERSIKTLFNTPIIYTPSSEIPPSKIPQPITPIHFVDLISTMRKLSVW